MSVQDVCLMVGILGGTALLSSWLGHRTGDSARDVTLMLCIGTCLLITSGVLYLLD